MRPVTQKDYLGCGVACTAALLRLKYEDALNLFKNGKDKAQSQGFLCKEIIEVLEINAKKYSYHYINKKIQPKIYKTGSIVFIKRSKRYPAGHYLCRASGKWMDPWINFPQDNNIDKAKSGFRKRLTGKPIYTISPVS